MLDIRVVVETKLGDASDLCVRAKSHWGYDPEFISLCVPALIVTADDLATSDVVGAYHDEQLAGVAQLISRDREVVLDKLFVEPQFIGTCIGRALFEWAVQRSTEWGATKITIEADPFAVPVYKASGCTQVGVNSSPTTGRELPIMEYSLATKNHHLSV